MSLIIVGCDPGPVTGIAALRYPGTHSVFQCDAGSALRLVFWLGQHAMAGGIRVVLAGEAFQAGRGAGARMKGAEVTRRLIAELDSLGSWHWRAAGLVKPWATDERLQKAGLLELKGAGPHAMDAARHALYAACHDAGVKDPLSRLA